jgi:hypothetical protein
MEVGPPHHLGRDAGGRSAAGDVLHPLPHVQRGTADGIDHVCGASPLQISDPRDHGDPFPLPGLGVPEPLRIVGPRKAYLVRRLLRRDSRERHVVE